VNYFGADFDTFTSIKIIQKMKKILFFVSLFMTCFAQAQFGIVQDKDGYVNVRDEQSTSSKIVGKLNSNTIIPIFNEENEGLKNSNWLLVEYQAEASGYIYKDRIKKIEDFETIKPIKSSSNSIEFSISDYKIQLETQKFNPKNHIITKEGELIHSIDGKDFYGSDGVLPQIEFKSFKLFFKGQEIIIPKDDYTNLYNLTLSEMKLTYNKALNQYYLFGTFSDGAGVFDTIWVLENGKLIKHIAQINFYA
jgi:hypothetical protein